MYTLYKDKVYNTAIGYLQNIQEAEEITQDVFLTLYKKADTFRGNSKVGTWIYRITINKSLNQLKKRKLKPVFGCEIQEWHGVDFDHPGVRLENKEKARFLFAAIARLPENQKTAFLLSYVEGLPRQEVANIMETTLKSIEGLLQRGKVQLKSELIGIYPEGNAKK